MPETSLDGFAGIYTCNTCEQRYGAEEMHHRNKRTPTGECEPCRSERRQRYYYDDPKAALDAAYAWRRANRGRWLDANRKHKYGLPYGEYERRLAEQGGGCAICHRQPGEKALHVDHCHATGVVRGLLCDRCNRGLGFFTDNPTLLAAAASYLGLAA